MLLLLLGLPLLGLLGQLAWCAHGDGVGGVAIHLACSAAVISSGMSDNN